MTSPTSTTPAQPVMLPARPAVLRRHDGVEERVPYALPPLRDLERWARVCESPADALCYLCREGEQVRPLAWSDQWTDESVYAMLDEVERVMRPRMLALLERTERRLADNRDLVAVGSRIARSIPGMHSSQT